MTISSETAAYNRRTAATVIRKRLGLLEIPPSDWTYEQRVEYNRELAQYIADNPQSFQDTEIQTAKDIASKAIDPLDDTSLMASVGLFGDAFLVEAETVLETGGKTLRTSIYIAVAIAVTLYFLPNVIKAFSSPSKNG